MSTTATAFLNAARAEVGYREGSDNDNKYGIWYGPGWNHQAYCAMGLSWVANKVGALSQIGGKWAYCPYWADWFRRRNRWIRATPSRGDIVFYDWTGLRRPGEEMHVGVVLESVDSTHIKTIEFNTVPGTSGNQSDGGGVWIRTRNTSLVVGYGKVLWTPETKIVLVGYTTHAILVVDGVWGARTTKRLQEVVGVTMDGEIGPVTLRALANWLSQKPTGTFTLHMKTALQHRIGVQADGVIGPVTVRALQRYLNRL